MPFQKFLIFAIFVFSTEAYSAPSARAAKNKHYIVTLRDNVDVDTYVKDRKLKARHRYRKLRGFSSDLSTAELKQLKLDRRRVLFVEEDGPVTVGEIPGGGILSSTQKISSGLMRMNFLNFPLARINNQNEALDVDVAMIDTGIDPHEDLNIFNCYRVFSLNCNDSVGHGTSVAGAIAALDNIFGTVGAASGVRLWNIKAVGPPPNNAWSYVMDALNYVYVNADKIEVLNMSIVNEGANAPRGSLQLYIRKIVRAGVVVVAGAGNNHRDLAGPDNIFGNGDDALPASLPEVMAVSAMDSSINANNTYADKFWVSTPGSMGTNYNSVIRPIPTDNPDQTVVYPVSTGGAIDVVAPGVNILAPIAGLGSDGIGRTYGNLTGTSMASPQVAGLVALYIAANGRATNEKDVYKIRQAIINQSQALQPQSVWANNPFDPDNRNEALAYPSDAWVPKAQLDSVRTGNFMNFTIRTASLNTCSTIPCSIPGYTYKLQGSSNLSTWFDLASFVGNGNFFQHTDDITLVPRRFYRVITVPTP